MHPRRPKLVDQIWRELHDGIRSQRWSGWLPQERHLAAELNVSRSTLRIALQRLRIDGRLEGVRSRGNRILAGPAEEREPVSRPLIVNLILQGSVGTPRPEPPLWVELLRGQLMALGLELRVIHSFACYRRRPELAMEELIRRNPADCWLVRLAPSELQEWLQKHGVPAVLFGPADPGTKLPAVDIAHQALVRHALGAMVSSGHRRIALLTGRDPGIGEAELEREFIAAAKASPRAQELELSFTRFEGGPDGLVRQIDKLLGVRNRPTAVFMAHALHCLTLWSHLGCRGLRIPEDLSVVAHIGGADLSYLRPEPACYRLSTATLVQKIARVIVSRIEGMTELRDVSLFPEFVRGGSLGPPPPLLYADAAVVGAGVIEESAAVVA